MALRSRAVALAICALLIGLVHPDQPARAAGGATLVTGNVLPHQVPIDGIVRLDLTVRNDFGTAWSAQDVVRLSWQTSGSRVTAQDDRPLGQPVRAGGTIDLTLVTLAPGDVGDFTLVPELVTHGSTLAVGAPIPFHLDGFLFKGHGNGHGLGLSQWGSKGRGEAGQDYRAILTAYYHGVRIDTRDTSGQVRIALTHGPRDLARPWARLFGPFPFIAGPVTVDGLPVQVGAGDLLGFGANAKGQPVAFVQSAVGSRTDPVVITRSLTVTTSNPAGLRTNLQQTLDSDFRTGSEQRRYAGTLQIVLKGGAKVLPVNVLPLEAYLQGVVPAEMPASWGDQALRAQAVAARTYALRKIALGGHGDYDLEGNEFDQAYSGLSDQRPASTEAVTATRGQVVTYQGRLIDALYSASDGGHTSDSEYGFIRWNKGLKPAAVIAYLRGIADPYDHAPAWQVGPFGPSDAATVLRDNGEDIGDRLLGIDVLQRSPAGRIMGVRLRGSGSTDEISGPYLRFLFGLPDTMVDIVGGS